MKKVILLSFVSLIVSLAFAQPARPKGSGGWGMGSQFNRMYDPKTVETITGDVVKIDQIAPMKGMASGVHLLVKTATETISVHLGPSWFINNQDTKIHEKDTIEVKGSRITFEGKPAIIAAEVKKGDEVLRLRDENGIPVWAGWRRK
jgi:hypothetical protein